MVESWSPKPVIGSSNLSPRAKNGLLVQWIRMVEYGSTDEGSNPSRITKE